MLLCLHWFLIAIIGFFSDWLQWAPITPGLRAFKIGILLFFIPAFFEEIFFRGFLLSGLARIWPRWAAWISTMLFVLWHPLQALTFGPPWASLFLNPGFLFSTLILGIILSHIRIKSGSLWPVIFIHWFAVLIWKILLGGPFTATGI